MLDEIKYFQKKYSYKIEIHSNKELIIPEFKIELFNKSKKLINKIEFLQIIPTSKLIKKDQIKEKKDVRKVKKEIKKVKLKKNLRTLWVRRKKN